MHTYRRAGSSLPLLLALALLCAGVASLAQPARAAVAYACGAPMAPDQAAADAEVQRSYADWKARYVTAQGAGGHLRVRRPSDGDDTVSEGIGYGMLLAAYRGDRATLDGLWGYARSHRDGNGLMHWRIDAGNNVVGYNAATDADEDMALALIVADGAWGGYRADALDLIGRIMQFEVEPGSNVLKPGDAWGGSQVTNPSYFAPASYKAFARYTGDARWDQVAASSYQIIANVNARSGAGVTGLQPDWVQASGAAAQGMGYNYTYDATRVPWRLAMDAAWNCDTRARAQLDKLNRFFKGVGAANIKDGYRLDGAQIGQWHNAAFVAPAASGAIVDGDAAYRAAMWAETARFGSENYYNDLLRLLGLLFMSGNMPAPQLAAPRASPTAAASTATPAPAAATSAPATAISLPSTATATSAPATATATSAPVAGAACTVRYAVSSDWGAGFVADVTITNNGGAATDGWRVGWTFGGNQRIVNLWNGAATQQGQAVSVGDAGWNRAIASGTALSFGFQAAYSGANAPPTGWTLNGAPCSSQ